MRKYRKKAPPHSPALEHFLGRHEAVWGPLARLMADGWRADIGRWVPQVAEIFERQWHLFDPVLREMLTSRAEEHQRTLRQEKIDALSSAIYELWYSRPQMPSDVPGLMRMAIAQAEAAVLAAEGGQDPATEPMAPEALEALEVPMLESEGTAPSPVDLTGMLARLTPAERAFAEHYRAHPDLSPAERDMALGKAPDYTDTMLKRLRRRLGQG